MIGSSDHVTHPLLLSGDQDRTKQENSHISDSVFSGVNVANTTTEDENSGDSNHDNDVVATTIDCVKSEQQEQLLKSQDNIISEDLTPETTSPSHVIPTDHVTPPTDNVTPPTDHMTSLIPLSELSNLEPDNHPSNDIVTSFIDQSDFTASTSDPLSRDVQSLLDSLRAPLPAVSLEGGRGGGRGRQNSVYFRASVKRRSRKDTYVVRPLIEGGDKVRERPLIEGGEEVSVV